MSVQRARTIIYLLRNDLRYHDNQVLCWACRNAEYLVPLYCFDPRHFKETYHFNLQKTGPHKLKFLLESLADLKNTFESKGSNLLIRKGKPETVISELIQVIGKDNVSLAWQEEVTKEETDVEHALKALGVPVETFWGSTLYHKDDIPFRTANSLPDVYSQFRAKVEKISKVRALQIMPDRLLPLPSGLDPQQLPTMSDLGVPEIAPDERSAFPFSGGETSALDRLNKYLWETDSVAVYKETRNGMVGSDYSTKFSTWLAHGCLSPRQIYWELKKYEAKRTSNQSTYWVVFELLWRDYFKYVGLKYGDKLFYLDGVMGKHIEWKRDQKLFEAWKDGRTGVPYVDANMREMAATGFMSNRGRQNVASFLTKDLKLDWRMGAEWFESMLIDHDVCSNYGNWQYSAGIGNDPRQDRKFNMVKQGLDYDPQGEYVRLWVPELENIKTGDVHTPWALSTGQLANANIELGTTYPNPIVVAPEWSRHSKKGSSARGSGRGGGRGRGGQNSSRGGRGHQRGIDFYFQNSNPTT